MRNQTRADQPASERGSAGETKTNTDASRAVAIRRERKCAYIQRSERRETMVYSGSNEAPSREHLLLRVLWHGALYTGRTGPRLGVAGRPGGQKRSRMDAACFALVAAPKRASRKGKHTRHRQRVFSHTSTAAASGKAAAAAIAAATAALGAVFAATLERPKEKEARSAVASSHCFSSRTRQ